MASGHTTPVFRSMLAGSFLCLLLNPVNAAESAASNTVGKIRCGWFDNPSPNNAYLVDRDGEWSISRPGGLSEGREAIGRWPEFKKGNFVFSGIGSYGYGCACMKVKDDVQKNEISEIMWAKEKSLATCRADPRKRDKEPFNPLK